MRISTGSMYQLAVNSLLDQQSKLSHTQQQLAAGKRVLTPADDPVASTLSLEIDQAQNRNTQFSTNITYAKSRLELGQTQLTQVTNTLQRIRELAVSALNGTQDANARKDIAAEVKQRFNELLGLANATDGSGNYLFSGSKGSTMPFTGNLGTGVSYVGGQQPQELQIGPDRKVQVTDTGLDVFGKISNPSGSGYQDMFSMVKNFITGLDNNNPNGNILDNIDAAMSKVSQVQAKIGGRLNSIDDQSTINQNDNYNMSVTQSQLTDLDYAQTVSNLNMQLAGYQAAQQSFSKIQGLSLFNYL